MDSCEEVERESEDGKGSKDVGEGFGRHGYILLEDDGKGKRLRWFVRGNWE